MSELELRNRVQNLIEEADKDFLEKVLSLSETNQDDVSEVDKNLVRERVTKYGSDFSKHTKLSELKKNEVQVNSFEIIVSPLAEEDIQKE